MSAPKPPNTDMFGISNALRAGAQIYFQTSRQTGRTTHLVESLKTGDRVVFADPREADRVKRLCRERGIDVECRTIPPEQLRRLYELGTAQGRTLFDHTWIELFYRSAIDHAEIQLDELQQRLSGYDVRHRETAAKFQQALRFRPFD